MIEFGVALVGIDQMDEDIGRAIDAEMARSMERVADKARASDAFVDRTGALRKSIHAGIEGSWRSGNLVGFVLVDAEHASHLEEGTRPHIIEPKASEGPLQGKRQGPKTRGQKLGGRVLAFPASGRTVFARRVNHPGTRPTHFLREAVDQSAIAERIAYAAAEATNRR